MYASRYQRVPTILQLNDKRVLFFYKFGTAKKTNCVMSQNLWIFFVDIICSWVKKVISVSPISSMELEFYRILENAYTSEYLSTEIGQYGCTSLFISINECLGILLKSSLKPF